MLNLVPDYTFFIQLGIFLICFVILKNFVFDPYLKLIHARREKTVGLKEEAEKAQIRAGKLRAEYDEFIRGERKKINTFVDESRKKMADEERKIIEGARNEVGLSLEGLRNTLRQEEEKARVELSPLVGDFSSRIASKLVGQNLTVTGVSSERLRKSPEASQGQ